MWREVLRVLKPGGHLVSFGGSRTYHRMACAVEDAGFEIRDQLQWIYGSGFPKSLDVSKAMDKAAGAEREVTGSRMGDVGIQGGNFANATKRGVIEQRDNAVTDAAKQWEGWGTALKPAHEPIVLARKPLGTRAINVLHIVELQLRERGVIGEIAWKREPVSGAEKPSSRANSSSTGARQVAETSAANADESETRSTGKSARKYSASESTTGLAPTLSDTERWGEEQTESCDPKSSLPTDRIAHAVANRSETSSPSITSTAAGLLTEKQPTERCTPSFEGPGSRPAIESFAGIATGLTGSMERVLIVRDPDGAFLWPKGLPRVVPSKPLTVAANVLEHGTGAMNIDGCRIGDTKNVPASISKKAQANCYGAFAESGETSGVGGHDPNLGRWPANILLDEDAAAILDAQSGELTSGNNPAVRHSPKTGDVYGLGFGDQCLVHRGADSGGASRFFYTAKASRSEREEGMNGAESRDFGRWSSGSDNPGAFQSPNTDRSARNNHPTVKPVDVMRWLVRLVTPPGGTVLDPFTGSGSTGMAAIAESMNFIGIEREADYVEIARRRIASVAPMFAREI